MKALLASTCFVSLAACGGSNLDPGAGDSPGKGTSTLSIDGSAHASSSTTNATKTSDFDTDFSVRIQLNGQTLTTGTVTVTSSLGKIPLVLDNENRWRATQPGYAEVYQLDVVSGPDKVEGVRVDGPDIHWFKSPTEGATVDASMQLPLSWDRGIHADTATLRTENIEDIQIDDTGNYMLAANALKSEKDKPHTNTVQLTRSNSVIPAGAVAGSTWRVTIENAVEVVAQPNPLAP